MKKLLAPPALLLAAASLQAEAPWESSAWSVESGLLWQAGNNTQLSYRIVPTQLSWRTSEVFGYGLPSGGRLSVRSRFGLLGAWMQQGPESYYAALNASPSIEWWSSDRTWALQGGAGGGLGLTDSRGVSGGQGQDFTFHWFARAGVERQINAQTSLLAGVLFLHMSNLGLTDPNPGIDAVGFTVGLSRRF
jgi:lipid A 3-O-deacylase